MKNNKKMQVSVIIPTWNREHSLKKAIQSALNQSLAPLEIIVSDDGSTDNSYSVVQSFKNPKVKWFSAKHLGLPAVARNRAIKESKGEWIAFLDSDDEWFPKKLEKQMALARQTGCLAICSNAYSVNEKGQRKKYLDYAKGMITFSDLIKINYVICSSAVVHSSLLSKCFGFPEILALKTGQDYAFWLRISTQTTFAYLSEPLVLYFDDPSKSNRKFTKNPYLQKKVILEDFLQWGWRNKIHFKYILNASLHYFKSNFDLLNSLLFF
jgi:glycosyltransferase involved in cell wall biosynthesis